MLALGYDEYGKFVDCHRKISKYPVRSWNAVTQGGDWGFMVSSSEHQNACVHVEQFWLHLDHEENGKPLWGKIHQSLA